MMFAIHCNIKYVHITDKFDIANLIAYLWSPSALTSIRYSHAKFFIFVCLYKPYRVSKQFTKPSRYVNIIANAASVCTVLPYYFGRLIRGEE